MRPPAERLRFYGRRAWRLLPLFYAAVAVQCERQVRRGRSVDGEHDHRLRLRWLRRSRTVWTMAAASSTRSTAAAAISIAVVAFQGDDSETSPRPHQDAKTRLHGINSEISVSPETPRSRQNGMTASIRA